MKFLNRSAFIIGITFFSSASVADGFYLGLGYGQTETDTGITGVGSGGTLDEDDKNYKVFAGYQINDLVAVEGFWMKDIESSLSGPVGTAFTNPDGSSDSIAAGDSPIVSNVDAYGVSLVGNVSVSEKLKLLGKLGYYNWDYTLTGGGVHAVAYDDDGWDPMYGIGAQYDFADNLSLRAEYEIYDADWTKDKIETKFDLLSVGLMYRF